MPSKVAIKVAEGSTAQAAQRVPDDRALERAIAEYLTENYAYPLNWTLQRVTVVSNGSARVPTAAITTAEGVPYLWVALVEDAAMDEAERQLRDILLGQRIGSLALVASPTGKRVLRRRFDTDKCEYITNIEQYGASNDSRQQSLFATAALAKRDGGLTPLSQRVENVFFECHSHIRDTDGLHADEALDELCKLLYTKLADEETTPPEALFRLQRDAYGTVEECAATVRHLYSLASEQERRNDSGSSGVFSHPMRLSSSALVRVVEELQRYSLSESATDIKGRAFQRVVGPAMRAGMGQYFTPDPVIRCMVEMASPSLNERLLDPFCGSAHFLTAAYLRPRTMKGRVSEQARADYAATNLYGLEKSDRMVRIARTDMRLQGDGRTHLVCTDSLLPFSNYPSLTPESFDVVLTNPPFGSILSGEAVAKLGHFELANGRKSVPLELVGLERAMQFLKPGGRLGIVLPESVLSNPATSHVREWIAKEAKVRAVISLPVETFSPFGANIKTSVLFVRKWKLKEARKDYPVFLACVENVGYDAAGRSRNGADLQAVAGEFRSFIESEGW